VAQRRRRVFVVAGSGDGFDPAEILFEREGMRRDTAPSREKGENLAPTIESGAPFSCTGNDRVEADAYVVAKTFTCGAGQNYDSETDNFIVGALKARTGLSQGVQDATVGHMIVHGTQDPCVSDIAFAQGRNNGGKNVLVQPIAFNSKDHGSDATTNMSPTLWSLGAYDANGGGSMAVAQAIAVDIFNATLNEDGPPMTFDWKMGSKARSISINEDQSPTLGAQADRYAVAHQMAVRRLTPRECERLQGFPDDYTAIPNAADGPRYKALGNSMAVPVMKWIGERINNYIGLRIDPK
jgi:DNA (cytosine-5)-methyltransferase 1